MWNWMNRRSVLKAAALAAMPGAFGTGPSAAAGPGSAAAGGVDYLPVTLDVVPYPKPISFTVALTGKEPVTLYGHYWYNAKLLAANQRCPAIVELNPYRCRDGTLYVDSRMYPWFAYSGYVCFRVDLQGSGSSTGSLTDEYTAEELSYCIQVINQIAALPFCDGNVGMMGISWSAINSLMVAAHDDCPAALKAVVVACGTDDRYNDDVHYLGGAMMQDNVTWAASMWGWLPAPPDPAAVGEAWRENWRQRIRNHSFWFEQWGTHQTRDAYWSDTSVRDHFDKVKVPVYVMSGWEDGYKNTVDRVLRGLAALGKPVTAMLGPYGHRYPFDAYPGPRMDWLNHIVDHWWDRWLRGRTPDEATALPPFTVWMGESREPSVLLNFDDAGHWVAEDHEWMARARDRVFFLAAGGALSPDASSVAANSASPSALTVAGTPLGMGTTMMETSSNGNARNPDIPVDQTADDRQSITFDTAPLAADLPCFGYPVVKLNLSCDTPLASICVRLCEVSPTTGQSHLVSYSFFNLAYRDGNEAKPQQVAPGIFAVEVPLNIIGHVFKAGWTIRLAVSPFHFPTMWQAPQAAEVTLHAGPVEGGSAPASLTLPERAPRPEDEGLAARIPPRTTYVDPELYIPTLQTLREGSIQRLAERVVVDGVPGTLVRKTIDSGRAIYGGVLDHLLVDVAASENIQILDGKPLSETTFTRYETNLQRGDWNVRAVTSTKVWSEQPAAGPPVFRYEATVQGYIDGELFEESRREGTIPRLWV